MRPWGNRNSCEIHHVGSFRTFTDPAKLSDRLHDASRRRRRLSVWKSSANCRRFPSMGQTEKTARIEHLIGAEAWTDAALR